MGTVAYMLLLGTAIIFAVAGFGAMLVLRSVPRPKAPARPTYVDPRIALARARMAASDPAARSARPAAPAPAVPAAAASPVIGAPPAKRRPGDIYPTLDDDYDSPTEVWRREEVPSRFADTQTFVEPNATPPRYGNPR